MPPRRTTSLITAFALAAFVFAAPAHGQGAPLPASQGGASAGTAGEAAGRTPGEQVASRRTSCAALTDADFGDLGDRFVGLMAGPSRDAVGLSLEDVMGPDGVARLRVAMGKRLSGCEPPAGLAPQGYGFMPIEAGWNAATRLGGHGPFPSAWERSPLAVFACVVTLVLVWATLLLVIIALLRWISHRKK